ncbi:MAG TPA: ChaN family lipoprotein [Pelomicrobium sp.]|nr:ChaN family lipoprotein [Pelomicrobium sp.]
MPAMAAASKASPACVPAARWLIPGAAPAAISTAAVMERIQGSQVVLLGEIHDNREHHRWQLMMLAALKGRNPDLVIGLEMFPRRVQPALDRWVAGELTEAEFLKQSEWNKVWRFDPSLYMPLFEFARMNRVPMVALNVEQSLIRDVGRDGLAGIDESRREGVTRPAPARAGHLARLRPVFEQHKKDGHGLAGAASGDEEAQFKRFVETQQVWDRGMAQRIAEALVKYPGATVAGIMGSGHVAYGDGVAHQLQDLDVHRVASLLPWDEDRECDELAAAGIADAVFRVPAPPRAEAAADRPRLGVWLEPAAGGVRIRQVVKDSVADAAGLREGDVVVEIAGRQARESGDVSAAVQRQAPGTWLPITVRRGEETLEVVAKFPPPAQ